MTITQRFCSVVVLILVLIHTQTDLVGKQGRVLILSPQISGTIRFFPELSILEEAPVGMMVQSTYFKTTPTNREFRRGFIEFPIPVFQNQIVSAQLILTENRAIISAPVPPVTHELSFYEADLILNTDDFDQPTSFVTSFETDANLPPQTFSFDVTALIDQFQGSNLGFRIKLAVDPVFDGFGSFGSSFGELGAATFPRIKVVIAPEPISIDIKPGSFPNSINPRSKGVIPVAILTTDTFNATTVDETTVRFGATGTEAAPVKFAREDVDGDGDTDMIFHFNTQETGIRCGDTSAFLCGKTFSGKIIEGSDSIKTVGCKGSKAP